MFIQECVIKMLYGLLKCSHYMKCSCIENIQAGVVWPTGPVIRQAAESTKCSSSSCGESQSLRPCNTNFRDSPLAPRAISYSIQDHTNNLQSHSSTCAWLYLSDLLKFYQPIKTLQSSSESLLVVHRTHLRQFGDQAFCITAPHLWNHLPTHVIH